MVWVCTGNRVIAVAAKRVAPGDAFGGQPPAFERTVPFKRLKGIDRTGGLIAAPVPDPRTEQQPIGPHGQREQPSGGRAEVWTNWIGHSGAFGVLRAG